MPAEKDTVPTILRGAFLRRRGRRGGRTSDRFLSGREALPPFPNQKLFHACPKRTRSSVELVEITSIQPSEIIPMSTSVLSSSNSDLAVEAAPQKKSIARYFTTGIRVLMGLMFFVFGLNGFLNFLPQPSTPLPEGAMAFAGALMKTGYMMPLIFITQLVAGTLLLVNRFVPLALVLLAPFLVNSIAFHVFLERSGLVMAGIVTVLEIYLAWAYRRAYSSLLTPRASAL